MAKEEVTLKTKYTKFIITCKGGAKHTVKTDKPITVGEALKAISNNIFIVAPGNIEVSGDLRDEIV